MSNASVHTVDTEFIFGKIYKELTLIPFIEKISEKFKLNHPLEVADAGLLSNDNIKAME